MFVDANIAELAEENPLYVWLVPSIEYVFPLLSVGGELSLAQFSRITHANITLFAGCVVIVNSVSPLTGTTRADPSD